MNKLLLLLLLLPFYNFGQDRIKYDVYYTENLASDGLKIQLTYRHKHAVDSTLFYYNDEGWGEVDLFNSLQLLKTDNPTLTIKEDRENQTITVYHPKSKKVVLVYRIKQDYEEPNYNAGFRPIVHDEYFHILGHSLFVIPEYFVTEEFMDKVNLTITWNNFPIEFKIHNNFGSEVLEQKLKLDVWEELLHSVFVGGDYRIHSFKHHDKPIYLVTRGEWHNGFDDEFLISNYKNAITSQRDFWQDYDQKYFTAILTPTVSQNDSLYRGSTITGSAVHNCFVMLATNNPFNYKEAYIHLVHHELMHNWIGQKIKNKYEYANYWFSEGFTDYYAYKNRLKIKDLTINEWQALFNEFVIKPHWKNPKKNIPNYAIKDGFWSDRDVEKVPYRRGAIFAFWLDNQILLNSDYKYSLDNLMNDILSKCKEEQVLFTDELLLDLASKYLDTELIYFFQKHIINGEDIDLENEKWIEGFSFEFKDSFPQLIINPAQKIRFIID